MIRLMALFVFLLAFSLITFLRPLFAADPMDDALPRVRITVRPDFAERTVRGTAIISVPAGQKAYIGLSGLQVDSLTRAESDLLATVENGTLTVEGGREEIRIDFQKILNKQTNMHSADRDPTLAASFMAGDDLVLIGAWHPRLSGPARYDLTVEVPHGLVPVSEADEVRTERQGGIDRVTFVFPHPRDGMSLVVGRYVTRSVRQGSVEISGYFFPEDEALMERYLVRSGEFIARYQELLGPYPFRRFAVVENRMPTGYGFATFTLIGQQVARLPFIVDTSLGHEIVHSWFGNSVYVDPAAGNWCEGLTTYYSDYLYRKDAGEGREYRKEILVDYASYVHKDNAFPLSRFLGRMDRASKAIGYGKGAMLFHMLREEIGDGPFTRAVRTFASEYAFKYAGWAEFRSICERESGRDLNWFFSQWLDRDDIPDLELREIQVTEENDGPCVNAIAVQKTKLPYRLALPVVVETRSGRQRFTVTLTEKEQSVRLPVDDTPKRVVLDPDCDLMRTLGTDELSPALSRLLGAKTRLYVVSPGERSLYAPMVEFLESAGFQEHAGPEPPQAGAVAVLGDPGGAISRMAGPIPEANGGVAVVVRENPDRTGDVVTRINAASLDQIATILGKLTYYGKYHELVFRDGKNIVKKVDYGRFGLGYPVADTLTIPAVATRDVSSLHAILEDAASKRIVFVSEQHDQFGHHLVQLEVIKGLHEKGVPIAVGMEMFQRPFQEVIDRYMRGEIGERAFLSETEYFTRWGFDYQLYRPIIQYCQKKGIPIVALNLPSEISKKVAREGLSSLTEEELRQVPQDLDLSNEAQKTWLKAIFDAHPTEEISSFDAFYQAQVLWDETMAESIHRYLEAHPERHMVVLAGIGHIGYGYGIPSRTKRLGGYDQAIIVNENGDRIDPAIGDYIVFSPHMTPPFVAKLGIIIDEKDGAVTVRELLEHGPAKAAGMKPGDQILGIGQETVQSVSDLKIALLFVKKGEKVQARIRRGEDITDLTIGPFLDPTDGLLSGPHGARNFHDMKAPHR